MRQRNLIVCIITGICSAMFVSCQYSAPGKRGVKDRDTTTSTAYPTSNILVRDDEMIIDDAYNAKADELFDDFLYNYINDRDLQIQRTMFPLSERLLDGSERTITLDCWSDDFGFMNHEYTTTIYKDEQEKNVNENTSLIEVSVEKIDLTMKTLTSYDFVKVDGKWNLHGIRNMLFRESDLNDFLLFYARFTQEPTFQQKSLARSIRISMMDPEDDTQTIDGFINREQWSTVHNGIPEGIISNIRYGQKYNNVKKLLLDKISIGNGMSETFYFAKTNKQWALVGYEN